MSKITHFFSFSALAGDSTAVTLISNQTLHFYDFKYLRIVGLKKGFQMTRWLQDHKSDPNGPKNEKCPLSALPGDPTGVDVDVDVMLSVPGSFFALFRKEPCGGGR